MGLAVRASESWPLATWYANHNSTPMGPSPSKNKTTLVHLLDRILFMAAIED